MSLRWRVLGCVIAGALALAAEAAGAHASATRFPLKRSEWVGVETARRVIRVPGLNRAVRAWMNHPRDRLELLYPVGSVGRVWASELANWLVALGIPRRHLALRPHLSLHRNTLWIELAPP
ncbi:MAG: hypothetical protein ACYCS1_06280 [Gammaproteobacteria bacterium]